MATSDSPLSVPNVTLAVARGASNPPATGSPLVRFDFAGGDTLSSPSVNSTGFAFDGLTRPIEQAPNGQLGLKFAYRGSVGDIAWEEIRYAMGVQLFETYERMVLWIPANYEQRKILMMPIDEAQDLSAWVQGDTVESSDNGAKNGIYNGEVVVEGERRIVIKSPTLYWYESWPGGIINTTRSLSITTLGTAKYTPANNNKFSAQWADGYLGNNSIIETHNEDGDKDPSFVHYHYSAGGPNDTSSGIGGLGSGESLPAGIDLSADPGTIRDFVIRRRRSTGGAVTDGLVEMWKDGVLVYRRNLSMYAEGANYFEAGYILGYANSGFDEQTTFYVTKFELYDSTRPEGLQA